MATKRTPETLIEARSSKHYPSVWEVFVDNLALTYSSGIKKTFHSKTKAIAAGVQHCQDHHLPYKIMNSN